MKPSERRAMEAEKRAMREAAEREKELEKQSADMQSRPTVGRDPHLESKTRYTPYQEPEDEKIKVQGDGYHREGFFGSHIRLITFIITLALLLTVLAPWGIDFFVEKSREGIFGKDGVEDKRDITADAILALSDLGDSLRWSHLESFNYTEYGGNNDYAREYALNADLVLRIEGTDLNGVPDVARLIDYRTGEYVTDIRKDSVRAFLSDRGY